MDADALIEWTLEQALASALGADAPPKLSAAMRHAVFPGGARVRPQLCLAVAAACADDEDADLRGAARAGAAIELLHCASLVHDDLPCFDDAEIRRGKPSVHVAFGEPVALLAGDALIVTAFDALAALDPKTIGAVLRIVSASVGPARGIVAGQAWESEPKIDLSLYHRAKTGALFVAAAMAGAASVGADGAPWRRLGERLGEAYQIADDIRDAVMDADALGKPAGQDDVHARPSAVRALGLRGAVDQLNALIDDAAVSTPDCAGAPALRALVRAQAARLTPASLVDAIG